MVEFRDYSTLNRNKWDDFVSKHENAWIDSKSYFLDFFEKSGYENLSFAIIDENKVVGIMPLFFIRSRFFKNRIVSGPILDRGGPFLTDRISWGDLRPHLNEIASTKKLDFIEIRNPPIKIPGYEVREDYVNFILKLDDPQKMWKEMDKRVRWDINKGKENLNLKIDDGKEAIEEFYELYIEMLKGKGSPPLGFDFIERLMEYEKSKIFFAKTDEKVVAGNMYIPFGDNIKFELSAYKKDYRDLQCNSFLIWKGIEYYSERGYEKFNFGRTLKGSGVYNFKKKWGGEERIMPYYYKFYQTERLPKDPREIDTDYSKYFRLLPKPILRWIGKWVRRKRCI